MREFEGKCANTRFKVNTAKNKVMRIGVGDEEMWREKWRCRSGGNGNLRRWMNSNI